MPTPAVDPTWATGPDLSPASWRDVNFELRDISEDFLVALPPTVGFREALGTPDPYTWDHPPLTDRWFPRGDGVPRIRPIMTLTGSWTYQDDEEALIHTAAIEDAMPYARSVWWRGQFLMLLDATRPGNTLITSGTRLRETTFNVSLNTVERVTRSSLLAIYPLRKLRIEEIGGGAATLTPLKGVSTQRGQFLLVTDDGTAFSFDTLEATYG
ncbi:hypothetical protein [Deinococcus sp. PEB2-63]